MVRLDLSTFYKSLCPVAEKNSRRNALRLAVATLLLAKLPLGSARATSSQSDPEEDAWLLLRASHIFHYPKSIRAVGKAYLEALGDADSVGRENFSEVDFEKELSHAESGMQLWLRNRIARDFEEGRIVYLNGWVLSDSEIRFCSLFAEKS